MKIYKPIKSLDYVIEYLGKTTKLTLVSSVAHYSGKIIPADRRWKVVDDSEFLKSLISSALENPDKMTIEALLEMELFYREVVDGKAQAGSTPEAQERVKAERYSSEKDLYSKSLKSDDLYKAESSASADEMLSKRPTIGELADEVRISNGKNRFAWRNNSKKPK